MLTCEYPVFVQITFLNPQKFSNNERLIKVKSIFTEKLVLKCFPYGFCSYFK